MTLQQALNIVKRFSHKGNISETGDEDTLIMLDAINLARRDILLELPKNYMRSTATISVVQGTATYALDSTVQKALLFRYTVDSAEYFLKKVETETEFYQKIYSASSSQQKPQWYFEAGLDGSGNQQIILFPTPDASYTVNYSFYRNWATDVLAVSNLGSAIPQVPAHLHNQICIGGIFYTLTAFDDPKSEIWEGRFERAKLKVNSYEEDDQDSLLSLRLSPQQINRGY